MVAQDAQRDKLKELILHIALQSEGDPSFGAVKLNKLLFFADFTAYLQFGNAITGEPYQKLPLGPAPRRVVSAMDQMMADRDLAMRNRRYGGLKQQEPVALRDPVLDNFTAEQIALVDQIILQWWGVSASKISDQSHEFIGWRFAGFGETIPYELALVGSRAPTAAEIEYGKSLESLAQEALARNVGRTERT
jgi:hypothetical protein